LYLIGLHFDKRIPCRESGAAHHGKKRTICMSFTHPFNHRFFGQTNKGS